ncbi:hypothetical protein ACQP2F_16315 [Actinoplanes sp. CA-030573]|uniref:hypothetical protein n=1 Tax=Actinoplanes sp. CA-030573 TaxID=3239898 RepID=UPI003D92AF2C
MSKSRAGTLVLALAGLLLGGGCTEKATADAASPASAARATSSPPAAAADPAGPAGAAPVATPGSATAEEDAASGMTRAAGGCSGAAVAAAPATAAPSAAGYLGTGSADTAAGVDIGPGCTVVVGGHFTGAILAKARRLTGGAAGAVVRLDRTGRTVLSATRVAGTVTDLQVRRGTGDIAVATDAGVRVLDPAAAAVRWKAPGAIGRVAIGASGTVAASGGTTVRIYNSAGRVTGTVALRGRTVNDIAVDDRTGLVFVTGFTQSGGPCHQVQIPFVRAYTRAGVLRWKRYDFAADELGGLCADARGDRLAMGRDGRLYLAGETAGGNTSFSTDGRSVRSKAPNVGYDKFTEAFNTGSAHLTYVARLDPATGAVKAGQMLLTRLDSGKGNTIVPRALAADAQGRVYVGGSAAAQLADRKNLRMNGKRLKDYAGGDAWLLVTSPDLRKRLLWTSWTDGGTGQVQAVAVDGPVAAVAADVDRFPFYTRAPVQTATGRGYLAVLPARR